jgi:hypothetical protein
MKLKSSLSFLLAGVAMSTALWFTACKKEEKAAPVITLSASTYTGKIGTTATTTATITAEAGLRALRITKYNGVTVDATFGTNGTETYNHSDHTLNYVLTDEGLAAPVRFKFEAEDNDGKVTTADFIITTEVSVRYLLTTYNWQWTARKTTTTCSTQMVRSNWSMALSLAEQALASSTDSAPATPGR